MSVTVADFWKALARELFEIQRDCEWLKADPRIAKRIALVEDEMIRGVAALGAERMRMFEALTFLVEYLKKNGGYMFGEDQEALRAIERLLAGVMP